jgi:hypothetical protein
MKVFWLDWLREVWDAQNLDAVELVVVQRQETVIRVYLRVILLMCKICPDYPEAIVLLQCPGVFLRYREWRLALHRSEYFPGNCGYRDLSAVNSQSGSSGRAVGFLRSRDRGYDIKRGA